ncbi:MAG: HEPN domain-containing protein [Planctomycetes bacterium]|nr:HEPN domain-containing protein [Planctomycetota bacterium]
MSVELLIANLLRVAREDLAGARLLSAAGNRNAIYLCAQAAEKVMRAVLTSERKHAGIKHQLDLLVNLVPDENPLKSEMRAIEHLGCVRHFVSLSRPFRAYPRPASVRGFRLGRRQRGGYSPPRRRTIRRRHDQDRNSGEQAESDPIAPRRNVRAPDA